VSQSLVSLGRMAAAPRTWKCYASIRPT
jgi:hypothetical protein